MTSKLAMACLFVGVLWLSAGCGRSGPTMYRPIVVCTSPTPAHPLAVGASQIWREYGEDVAAADRQYQGKEVLVSGEVAEFETDHEGRYSVGMVTWWFTPMTDAQRAKLSEQDQQWLKDGAPPNLRCYISPEAQPTVAKIKLGSDRQMKLVGKCDGRKPDPMVYKGYVVVLNDCRLAE